MMREKIIDQCLQVMKRDDVKRELKELFHPVIDLIMQEIYPYIYLSVIFVIISFLLTIGIFVMLMRTSLLSNVSTAAINSLEGAWCCAWHHPWASLSCSQNWLQRSKHVASWQIAIQAATEWTRWSDSGHWCNLTWTSTKLLFETISKM